MEIDAKHYLLDINGIANGNLDLDRGIRETMQKIKKTVVAVIDIWWPED